MKRLLFATVLLAVLAATANATLTPMQSTLALGGPGIPNKTADGRKPIAVVTNSEWEAAALRNRFALTDNSTYGRLWKLLKEQGQQVDFISSSVFRPKAAGDNFDVYNIWRYLGDRYSVVIVRDIRYYWSGDIAYRRRFFCPDSTNAQIINVGDMYENLPEYDGPSYFVGTGAHFGEYVNNSVVSSGGDGLGFAFTTTSGDSMFANKANIARAVYAYPNQPYLGTSVSGTIGANGTFHTSPAATSLKAHSRVVASSGPGGFTGRVWINTVTAGDTACTFNTTADGGVVAAGAVTMTVYKPDSTHWNVRQVVQLYKPPSSGTFNKVAGSYSYQADPDSLSACYSDTVATHASEALPIAWRVYWQPPSSALDWLGGDVTTSRHVDYVPRIYSVSASDGSYLAMYLYALIARYAKLDPIPLAYEWDNVGAWGANKYAAGDTASVYPAMWPEPDSLKAFHDYVIAQGVPADFPISGAPDSIYAKVATSQGGKQYAFLQNHKMIPANRDTVTTHLFASPLGVASTGAFNAESVYPQHRKAFSTSTDQAGGVRGIYQRLASNDSAYAALFGQGHTAPYLSAPFDFTAPLDLRAATLLSTAGNGQCPPESLFRALALAGKVYIRGWTSNLNTTNGGANPLNHPNISSVPANSSTAPSRYFPSPDASVWVSIPSGWSTAASTGGGKVRVRCVGAAAFTEPTTTVGTPPNSRNRYAFEATIKLGTLLGVATPLPSAYQTQADYGEAALGSGYLTQTMLGRSSDFSRVRVANQWPQYLRFPDGNGKWANYQATKEHARIALFSPIAALNSIAGHPLVRWVQPWQVYDK